MHVANSPRRPIRGADACAMRALPDIRPAPALSRLCASGSGAQRGPRNAATGNDQNRFEADGFEQTRAHGIGQRQLLTTIAPRTLHHEGSRRASPSARCPVSCPQPVAHAGPRAWRDRKRKLPGRTPRRHNRKLWPPLCYTYVERRAPAREVLVRRRRLARFAGHCSSRSGQLALSGRRGRS